MVRPVASRPPVLRRFLFQPVVASLLAQRGVALFVSLFAVLQTALVLLHLPGWPCPAMQGLHEPCPGCGLSRAIAALVRGDFGQMLELHAFAPLALFAALLFAAAALLPAAGRAVLVRFVERTERRTAWSSVLLVALVVYWLVRLGQNHGRLVLLLS